MIQYPQIKYSLLITSIKQSSFWPFFGNLQSMHKQFKIIENKYRQVPSTQRSMDIINPQRKFYIGKYTPFKKIYNLNYFKLFKVLKYLFNTAVVGLIIYIYTTYVGITLNLFNFTMLNLLNDEKEINYYKCIPHFNFFQFCLATKGRLCVQNSH